MRFNFNKTNGAEVTADLGPCNAFGFEAVVPGKFGQQGLYYSTLSVVCLMRLSVEISLRFS